MFWQFINQTINVCVNYANRNPSNPMNYTQLAGMRYMLRRCWCVSVVAVCKFLSHLTICLFHLFACACVRVRVHVPGRFVFIVGFGSAVVSSCAIAVGMNKMAQMDRWGPTTRMLLSRVCVLISFCVCVCAR